MVTIYDVARKAKVSPMTVSRVINRSASISEKTRQKVEEAIRELDYIPNKQAQSLVSKATRIVALIIPDISNPYFTNLTRGAEDKAHQAGYQLLLGNTDENIEKESKYIELLLSAGADGVLFAPASNDSSVNVRKLNKRHVPFVFVDRMVPGESSDVVLGDNHTTTRKLIEHLSSLGHQRIALLNGPSNVSIARERLEAYQDALRFNGIEFDPQLVIETGFKQDNLEHIVGQMVALSSRKRPTAIIAANNFIGVNALRALQQLSIRVPEDVSLACFDDPVPIPEFNPFLTVAAQPAYDMGYIGMQMLIERMESSAPSTHRKVLLPSELIVRASTAAPR